MSGRRRQIICLTAVIMLSFSMIGTDALAAEIETTSATRQEIATEIPGIFYNADACPYGNSICVAHARRDNLDEHICLSEDAVQSIRIQYETIRQIEDNGSTGDKEKGRVLGVRRDVENPAVRAIVRIPIIYNGACSTVANAVNLEYGYISPALCKSFSDLGWKVELTDGAALTKRYGFPYLVNGITDIGARRIYLSADMNMVSQNGPLHEFGHFIDSTCWSYTGGETQMWSDTQEFQKIYATELKLLPHSETSYYGSYYDYGATEYFAEAVAAYYKYPVVMVAQAPKTFGFIHTLISDYRPLDA